VTSRGSLQTFELYLARHGETAWSLSGRHTGTTDIPLTTRGEENAEHLRDRLQGLTFDVVYSSPMQRARRTAELAGFPHPSITDLLKEADYGRYEGLTTAQIHGSDPGWELYHDGCPGGETPVQLYARAERFIELATRQTEAGRVIAFAHGHILRAIAVAWIHAGITLAAGLQLDVATISVLRDGDHGRVLALWNAA
jgi:probable phosphoglycerate mutase